MPAISAVVLAGGQGRRLGRDKAFLPLNGRPLIAWTVDKLSDLSDDVIVVTNRPASYRQLDLPVRLVHDEQPGVGALMGLYSGLKAASHRYAVVVACDMPFLSVPLLRHMVTLVSGYDVVIPRLGSWQEPLHSIYGDLCLPAIERQLDLGRRKIISFFPEVRVRYVGDAEIEQFDPEHRSFLNINTPDDWNRVESVLGA